MVELERIEGIEYYSYRPKYGNCPIEYIPIRPDIEIKEIVETYGERWTTYRLIEGIDFTAARTGSFTFDDEFLLNFAKAYGHETADTKNKFKCHRWDNERRCLLIRCIDKIESKEFEIVKTTDPEEIMKCVKINEGY